MTLLVRAGEMFHRSLEVDDTLYNVAHMAVESFAGLCLFDLIDEHSDRLYVTAGAHREPSYEPLLKSMGSSILYDSNREGRVHPAIRVTQTGESFFLPVIDEATILSHAASPQHADFMRRMGYRSKIVVPVTAQAHVFGALTFVRTSDEDPFDEGDVQAAEELGRRAGLAVANAKQYHREQHVAATLQRAFLSENFPRRPGLRFSALYRPGSGDTQLGGDWYDAFETRDGSIVMTIGDVSGKGIEAARLMVQLRQSVRIAAALRRDPSEILGIVNEALLVERTTTFATAFVAVLPPGSHTLHYAAAGHPPPFIRWDTGETERLSAPSPPLGISADITFTKHEVVVHENALLVLYTDGITEATRNPVAGEEMLERLIANEAVLQAANPARFLERAVAREGTRDDVAVLAVRFGAENSQWRFDVGDSAAGYAIKRHLIGSIADAAAPSDDELRTCETIISELIGNAVRHAPGPLSISLSVEQSGVFVHVIDEGPGFDLELALPEDVWSESGRGLFLISALARGISASRLPGYGSYVCVRLPVDVSRRGAGLDRAKAPH
ncbi:MAG: SpoIIE family protein phosphatase [Candidatus Velthaea sp.]